MKLDPEEMMKLAERVSDVPTCRDFDEDCDGIEDKVHYYLYDPAKGACPFLHARANRGGE